MLDEIIFSPSAILFLDNGTLAVSRLPLVKSSNVSIIFLENGHFQPSLNEIPNNSRPKKNRNNAHPNNLGRCAPRRSWPPRRCPPCLTTKISQHSHFFLPYFASEKLKKSQSHSITLSLSYFFLSLFYLSRFRPSFAARASLGD